MIFYGNKNSKIPQDLVNPLTEEHLAGLDETAKKSSEVLAAVATAAAWHVGVISPGFLGLLWNAQSLAAHTHLPKNWRRPVSPGLGGRLTLYVGFGCALCRASKTGQVIDGSVCETDESCPARDVV